MLMNMMIVLLLLIVLLLSISTIQCYQRNHHHQQQRGDLRMAGGPIRGDVLPKLITLTSLSNRGLIKDNNNDIIEIMDQIATTNERYIKSDKNLINKVKGNWKLLWTTEKETLFFAEKGLFGNKVTDIRQVINDNSINNIIEFENNAEFTVLGDIDTKSDIGRVNFKFKQAKLILPPFINVNIPPIGSGWFDNIYVNEKYRLSKDVRGDYLISQRLI